MALKSVGGRPVTESGSFLIGPNDQEATAIIGGKEFRFFVEPDAPDLPDPLERLETVRFRPHAGTQVSSKTIRFQEPYGTTQIDLQIRGSGKEPAQMATSHLIAYTVS